MPFEFIRLLFISLIFLISFCFTFYFKGLAKLFGVIPFLIGGVILIFFPNAFIFQQPQLTESGNDASIVESTSDLSTDPLLDSLTDTPPIPTVEIATSAPSTEEVKESILNIAITEVMASPCNSGYPSSNEYIELYNYGEEPIDVGGWLFSLSGEDVNPDKIVSWETRNYKYGFGTGVIIDSTILQPKQFAIILPSNYHVSTEKNKMPYRFPPNTVILTMEEGTYLVDEQYSIQGWITTTQVSGVYLYIGTSSRIDQVISTYGIEVEGLSPEKQTGFREQLPIRTELCYSVERRIASGPDTIGNWDLVENGNPGLGTDDY